MSKARMKVEKMTKKRINDTQRTRSRHIQQKKIIQANISPKCIFSGIKFFL